MAIARRSLQSITGITLRTRKGTPILPESSPQNSQSFGVSNQTAGSGPSSLLAAPGAGFCWVITSLYVSTDITQQGTNVGSILVHFTGNISVSAGGVAPLSLISVPTAVAANTSFQIDQATVGPAGTHFTVTGTAYKATVATVTNPDTSQVIATPIDSNPAGDLG